MKFRVIQLLAAAIAGLMFAALGTRFILDLSTNNPNFLVIFLPLWPLSSWAMLRLIQVDRENATKRWRDWFKGKSN